MVSSSAGARITETRSDLFPGRRGARKIFWKTSACKQLDPAGVRARPERCRWRLHPGVLRRRRHGRGRRVNVLGSDRMVEMVTTTALEEIGGATSPLRRVGDEHFLCADEDASAASYATTCPTCRWSEKGSHHRAVGRAARHRPRGAGPGQQPAGLQCAGTSRAWSTRGRLLEIQALWARAGGRFGRLAGEVVGVVANNSMFKEVLFVDSADKATRFVHLRRLDGAVPVPVRRTGFMVGAAVESGIIRHGAR